MRKPFTEHPEFVRVAHLVNEALAGIAFDLGCVNALHGLDKHTNRVVDDVTKLLLRAYDRDRAA